MSPGPDFQSGVKVDLFFTRPVDGAGYGAFADAALLNAPGVKPFPDFDDRDD